MTSLEPRDARFVEAIAATVMGLHLAIERGAPALEVMGHICLLVNSMIEHRDTAARPYDKALVAAVARLGEA